MNLARAIEIAVAAHRGQTDKSGAPYILHPLRVMFALATDEERIVGVLHDVVEDSAWTLAQLAAEGFSPTVLAAVEAVTRSPDDADYAAFIARAASTPIARAVKRADLLDNLNASRLSRVGPAEAERLDRYLLALAALDATAPGPTDMPEGA
jgi:(p)ppGpp synthase/HD superfamily hydrolase